MASSLMTAGPAPASTAARTAAVVDTDSAADAWVSRAPKGGQRRGQGLPRA